MLRPHVGCGYCMHFLEGRALRLGVTQVGELGEEAGEGGHVTARESCCLWIKIMANGAKSTTFDLIIPKC